MTTVFPRRDFDDSLAYPWNRCRWPLKERDEDREASQ